MNFIKKSALFSALALLGMSSTLTGCDSEKDIVFDHELPQFELREDAILFEVITPIGTTSDDDLYIVGDFNGGEEAAKADAKWHLMQAPNCDAKWGIYLDPNDFVNGKTLADGYYFVSTNQGMERTLKNEEVVRTENPGIGTRTNLTVRRWKAYFDTPQDPSEIEHDGYVVYVVDNSGYDDLAMYAWGDAEAFGGWPGMNISGTVDVNGTTFKYFDTGAANEGLNLNLIFNNNGNGKQLADYNVTLNQDYYLELTPDGVKEYDLSSSIKHDGYAVFVANQTGWTDLHLYMWGDVNDLNGGWPGMEPTGTVTINGVEYTYFDMGEANTGLGENVILNSPEANKQLSDVAYTIDHDLYLEATLTGAKEIDPDTYTPGGEEPTEPETPTTPETPSTTCTFYFENLTGWDAFSIYAWGDDNAFFGDWPGVTPTDSEVINGRTFLKVTVTGHGESENLIFNNAGGGTQFDGPNITADRDYYFTVTDSGCEEISASSLGRKRVSHRATAVKKRR
jgi:hypothetical protein